MLPDYEFPSKICGTGLFGLIKKYKSVGNINRTKNVGKKEKEDLICGHLNVGSPNKIRLV